MILRISLWAGIVALVRIGALWFLVGREWTHHQSLAALPLVLLLYPEGLVLPSGMTWTATLAVTFSAVLAAGTALWVTMVLVIARSLQA